MPEHVEPARKAHPILFLIMFLPLGITNGYVVVTLAYLLSHAGVSVAAIAALAAWSLFPQTWKFIWAPLVDTTLNNKVWFLISAIATGLLMAATAVVEPTARNLMLIEAIVVGFSLTSTFNCMAADALMAHATPLEEKAAPAAGARRAISAARASAAAPGCGSRSMCIWRGSPAPCSASPA